MAAPRSCARRRSSFRLAPTSRSTSAPGREVVGSCGTPDRCQGGLASLVRKCLISSLMQIRTGRFRLMRPSRQRKSHSSSRCGPVQVSEDHMRLTVCVNRTPVAGDIHASRDKRDIDVSGCGLANAVAQAPKNKNFVIWLNITTPYMTITSGELCLCAIPTLI